MKHTFKHVGTAALALTLLMSGCSQTAGQTSDQEAGESTGNSDTQALSLVTDIPTTQYFTDEAVKEEDVTTILTAGVNAPSAMNGQPWHFTAITDQATLQQIADEVGGGFPAGMEPPVEGEGGTDIPSVPPEGRDESMELPEGVQLPENWDAGMELPEGVKPPEGWDENMELPEGVEPPTAGDGEDAPSFPAGSDDGSGAAPAKADITGAPLAIVVSCAEGSELDAGLACQTMSVTAQLLGYGTKILTSPTIALNGEKQEEYRQLLGIPEDYSAAVVLLVGYADSSMEETDGATGATERSPLDEQVTYVTAE